MRERFAPAGPVLLAGGPATEDGFYYDFGLPRGMSDEDLAWLEGRLKELIARNAPFIRQEVSADEARRLFRDQPYKLETLASLEQGRAPLSLYRHADFVDLCEGPHVAASGAIAAAGVKLLSVAGAYWRGDEGRPMLTRIYGTVWRSAAELDAYLARRAEAERRDHRRLGRELELFFFHPTAPGMPYWLPRGLQLLNELLAYWRVEHARAGYQEIASPLLNDKQLWETSGHWEHYKSDMFLMELPNGQVFGVKPMNCPNAMLVFNHRQRSYRELPLRLSDCDVLHRHERSGTLHGLLRAQKFQQDDAHIFCAEEQIAAEFARIFALVDRFYALFDLVPGYRLSTRPKEFLGDAATWDQAETALKQILEARVGAHGYAVGSGDGAFYGPKIDILVKDALGRTWQLGTIQLDFQLPQRFHCAYVDQSGAKRAPVVIHRVIYGSLERFIGVLLEHTAGQLPVWLAPVQARVLPIADRHLAHAERVLEQLQREGLRADLQAEDSLAARIRRAAPLRVPYLVVIGDRELASGQLALRARGGRQAEAVTLAELVARWRSITLAREAKVC